MMGVRIINVNEVLEHMAETMLLPRLVRAALARDVGTVESLSYSLVRKLRKTDPALAQEISNCLVEYGAGASPMRSVGIEPPPTDQDSHLSLVQIHEPTDVPPPVLVKDDRDLLDRFIMERQSAERLVSQGLRPPTSLLLTGAPGVGKTYTAQYVAAALRLPLFVLDLATALSSYLGKTGQNIRGVLDYARAHPCVLLLDEFDAIAKKRDDPTDLGELKRVVNVLLKELEVWPTSGVIIAATNHPGLLDRAIWRRFDRSMDIGLPGKPERRELLIRCAGDHWQESGMPALRLVIDLSDGMSSADICRLVDRALRRVVLDQSRLDYALIQEIATFCTPGLAKRRAQICRLLREQTKMSLRDIASCLGISPSTVHHHLKGHTEEGDPHEQRSE